MSALEIVLLFAGIICIVVSFIMSPGKQSEAGGKAADVSLDEAQKTMIRNQIDEVVAHQMENVSEQTEAELDKISNTKVLELNEYADTVFEEMNRNHNETMFLYDMLNEKSKEIKTTVRNINLTKQQVEKLCEDSERVSKELADITEKAVQSKTVSSDDAEKEKTTAKTTAKSAKTTKTASKTAVKKTTKKSDEVQNDKEQEKALDEPLDDSTVNAADEEVKVPKKRGRKKKSETEAEQQAKQEEKLILEENQAQEEQKPLQQEAAETETIAKQPANMDSAISKTQTIISMHKQGMDPKAIAKELGIGVGEVTLIIGLYK